MDGLLGVAGMIMNIGIRGHSRPTFSASKFFYVMKGLGDLAEKHHQFRSTGMRGESGNGWGGLHCGRPPEWIDQWIHEWPVNKGFWSMALGLLPHL